MTRAPRRLRPSVVAFVVLLACAYGWSCAAAAQPSAPTAPPRQQGPRRETQTDPRLPPLHGTEWYRANRRAHTPWCTENIVLARGDGFGKDLEEARPWSLQEATFADDTLAACRSPEDLYAAVRNGERVWSDRSQVPWGVTDVAGDLAREQVPSVFVPRGCRVRFYSPEEACEVASRYSHIVFMGDSLTRHMTGGLFLALTGDYVYGGLPPYSPNPDLYTHCRCDGQFSEHKVCRSGVYPQFNFTDPRMLRLCENVPPFAFALGMKSTPILAPLAELCSPDPRPRLVTVQGGLHFGMNAGVTWTVVATAIKERVEAVRAECPHKFDVKLVWITREAQSRNVDKKYEGQKREYTAVFNADTTSRAKAVGMFVLDFFNVSRNAAVSDGVHYLADVNLFKAQTVVNLLDLLTPALE